MLYYFQICKQYIKYLPVDPTRGVCIGISTVPIATSSRHEKTIGAASNIVVSPSVRSSIALAYKKIYTTKSIIDFNIFSTVIVNIVPTGDQVYLRRLRPLQLVLPADGSRWRKKRLTEESAREPHFVSSILNELLFYDIITCSSGKLSNDCTPSAKSYPIMPNIFLSNCDN